MIIAFDIDGTLITYQDKPRWDIIELVKILSKYHTVIAWSGGGQDYTESWIRRLFLQDYITGCYSKPIGDTEMTIQGELVDPRKYVDISFDDEMVDLAKINIKI